MQYQGYWYCPTELGQLPFEEWLAAKRRSLQLGRLHVKSGNSSRSKRRRMLNFKLRKTRIRTVDGGEEEREEEEKKEKEEEEGRGGGGGGKS